MQNIVGARRKWERERERERKWEREREMESDIYREIYVERDREHRNFAGTLWEHWELYGNIAGKLGILWEHCKSIGIIMLT